MKVFFQRMRHNVFQIVLIFLSYTFEHCQCLAVCEYGSPKMINMFLISFCVAGNYNESSNYMESKVRILQRDKIKMRNNHRSWKLISTLSISILLLTGALPVYAKPINKQSDSELAKNYAFARCIANAYKSPEIKEDASNVAGGYLQFGDFSMEYAQAASELSKKWLRKKYSTSRPMTMQLMKCIDFSQSIDLQKLIKKYKSSVQDSVF